MSVTDVALILRGARTMLADPAAWTKGTSARDAQGLDVSDVLSPEAACFCAVGAVFKAANYSNRSMEGRVEGAPTYGALRYLKTYVRKYTDPIFNGEIHLYNDSGTTTHEDVLRMFDYAIEQADPVTTGTP